MGEYHMIVPIYKPKLHLDRLRSLIGAGHYQAARAYCQRYGSEFFPLLTDDDYLYMTGLMAVVDHMADAELAGPRRPKLLFMSSWAARGDLTSPLLRFVRDYADILKQFELHTTDGTGQAILGTGLYDECEITRHRRGPEGGVVQLAAMIARRECAVAIFFSDTKDLGSNVPENLAIQRVCKELQVRLITTLEGAEQWALHEARRYLDHFRHTNDQISVNVFPSNWEPGHQNVSHNERKSLPIEEQTLALIAHDKKKEEMVLFVNRHLDYITRFHRVLSTGATGFLLKLLYSDFIEYDRIRLEAQAMLGSGRFRDIEQSYWLIRVRYSHARQRALWMGRALDKLGHERSEMISGPVEDDPPVVLKSVQPRFIQQLMTLPGGSRGGDILIANEILENACHAIVFFEDPSTVAPEEPDIRLFERTCQLWSENKDVTPVFATYLSDPQSADQWARNMHRAIKPYTLPDQSLAHQLRQTFHDRNLREVVLVEAEDDQDSDELGRTLARACAGYFHQWLWLSLQAERRARIGIAWGWGSRQVLRELQLMAEAGLLRDLPATGARVIWSPLIGTITAQHVDHEASAIAIGFQEHYGIGEVATFVGAGFAYGKLDAIDLARRDRDLMHQLSQSTIILVSGAPWTRTTSLYRNTALKPNEFPPFKDAVGTISTIFLDEKGNEVQWAYSSVGLQYAGLQDAARQGAVLLMCGGEQRRALALAALRGGLASVLVTTRKTAQWILTRENSPSEIPARLPTRREPPPRPTRVQLG